VTAVATRETGPQLDPPSRGGRGLLPLVVAESDRLLSRRFTRIALVIVLLVIGAFQLSVNASLRPPTAAEQASSQAQYEEARRFWEENERTCDNAGSPPDCRYPEPQLSEFSLSRPFAEVAAESLEVSVYLVALAALMVAGSFIGAEYSSGSIGNWLSFLPRRGRVLVSKLLTVTVFSALASAVATGLALLAALVLARRYDLVVGSLSAELGMLGRGVLVAVALAVVGFCLAMIGRHTAAAIGGLLGYLFVWFVRNAILSEAAWAQRLTPWTPEGNLAAVVNGTHQYFVPVRTVGPDGLSIDYVERTVSLTHGLVYWAVLLAVVLLVTAVIFRRRDVN
jgi:ABC-2 type transport system permease protein